MAAATQPARAAVAAPAAARRAAARRAAPRRAAARAAGDLASFGAGLGPTAGKATPSDAAKPNLEKEKKKDVWSDEGLVLESDAGVDYSLLQKELKAGNWELADNEHRRLLCELAGEEAAERKWVYFTEIAAIPEKDMKMLDTLWLTYSKGRYGFSVQRKVWKACKCRWADFFKKIDWVQGENMAYRKWPEEFKWEADSAEGHLPLTNALRGTQLFEAVMMHPAFDDTKKKAEAKKAVTENNSAGSYL